MLSIKSIAAAAPIALLLAGCGMGEPVSIEEVEAKMTEDFSEDGAEVTWISVEEGEEGNDYNVWIDVVDGEETSTKNCDVSMTSMSSSYSCQTMTPSVIDQAAELLRGTYTERGIDLLDYEFERTGEDMAFGGDAKIQNTANGARALITCAGEQEGTQFNINCDDGTLRPVPAG